MSECDLGLSRRCVARIPWSRPASPFVRTRSTIDLVVIVVGHRGERERLQPRCGRGTIDDESRRQALLVSRSRHHVESEHVTHGYDEVEPCCVRVVPCVSAERRRDAFQRRPTHDDPSHTLRNGGAVRHFGRVRSPVRLDEVVQHAPTMAAELLAS